MDRMYLGGNPKPKNIRYHFESYEENRSIKLIYA
jgi:hypothetical protein